MLAKRSTAAAALVLAFSVSALPLAGCETIERETGIGKEAQTGALAGAAFGGIIAALADANPAWIAASTILGGVTGGYIGDYLGKKDAEKHAEANLNALNTLGEGQSASWSDAETGNNGSTTVHEVVTMSDGTTCKRFTETVHAGSKTVTQEATACRAPGGSWTVQQG